MFLLDRFPNDSGPIYQETIAGRLPVEPFNTFSNLIFIVLLIYFGRRIYQNPKQHPFFLFAIPVIFISWIGGTMFHGTRSHEFWLLLDWIPIMIVCLGAIIYFIRKIKKKWWQRIGILLGMLIVSILPRFLPIPIGYRTSFGYAVTALAVVTPLVWYAYKTHWRNVKYIAYGGAVFGIALLFRTLDKKVELLPMGTHWLWHTFGGIAVFFLLYYIYKDEQELT
ncbi:ceramidase domain-containing protein [Tenacibaculum caenipelagi]|uniref:Hemolysin III n=1 Tax=Tenacibaculum caenipelagi TaxID=1325435 RepID=A0A4R6TGJ8_9FLAO|nr:ceramidase domain-containing protein [Tenacibaculum caenipelagi]TDQ27930.1 hemolysin III [Tenacibaculum caenipelagi]